ncbi:hypothetical protein [Candidatus Nitrosocosmicus sp. T]
MSSMGSVQYLLKINGLHDVLKDKNDQLPIDNVVFYHDGNDYAASIIITTEDVMVEGLNEAKYLVSTALSKIVFAYNTEAFIDDKAFNYIDLDSPNKIPQFVRSFGIRWNYVKEDPKVVLPKLSKINTDKKGVMELALAYYQLSHYFNPLRLETLFSSMSVLIKDLLGEENSYHLETKEFRNKIAEVMKIKDSKFDVHQFNSDWQECYTVERNSISHGRPTNLIALKNQEHMKLVNKVASWTITVFYYYIDLNQD